MLSRCLKPSGSRYVTPDVTLRDKSSTFWRKPMGKACGMKASMLNWAPPLYPPMLCARIITCNSFEVEKVVRWLTSTVTDSSSNQQVPASSNPQALLLLKRQVCYVIRFQCLHTSNPSFSPRSPDTRPQMTCGFPNSTFRPERLKRVSLKPTYCQTCVKKIASSKSVAWKCSGTEFYSRCSHG